jgi:hypothetical protein
MTSRYAETVPSIVLDLHAFLVRGLELPDPFRSSDPGIGEAYGLLSPQDLSQGASPHEMYLNCTFLASSAFADYWQAQQWAIGTGLNLDHLIAIAQQQVNKRSVLGGFEKSSNISIGNPRAPLQQPQGQTTHIWVVDILCPCRLKLLIHSDPVCGHR